MVYGEVDVGDAGEFMALRPKLFGVAYRMLGSVSDAEDVVQEAYLRWQQVERADVDSPEAFLTTVVVRLSLDELRSARARRERYVGPWLPEPLVVDDNDPAVATELADSLSMAFLVLLEALSPLERAAFLLREVFGYGYDELAAMLDKDAAACRQLVSRARRHVEARRQRYDADRRTSAELARRFVAACLTGDLEPVVGLLTEDVTRTCRSSRWWSTCWRTGSPPSASSSIPRSCARSSPTSTAPQKADIPRSSGGRVGPRERHRSIRSRRAAEADQGRRGRPRSGDPVLGP
jgi:RNA polymerase sigma factor (sigma-70 family)